MSNVFNFCPECGSKKIETLGLKKWKCPDCGFTLYNNVAAAVGLVICDGQGNVLFEKRAKEPRKGFLALPGGFCDMDESAEEGAVRECIEETGTVPRNIKYIATFPNTYEYKGITYKTCDIFFSAEVVCRDGSGNEKPLLEILHPQESEVAEFSVQKVGSAEDVEKLPLAFNSAKLALNEWLKSRG